MSADINTDDVRMQLWHELFRTPFDQVKAITGKDYTGNSPKPYYIVQLLTKTFGPCGIGWGYEIEDERFERFSETDFLHVAKVRLWYMRNGQRGIIEQMGQTKATYMTNAGKFKVDEDAPKKSVTDALVKCASYLGAAGDIFSGRWDDSKYVAELRKEATEGAKDQPKDMRANPTKLVADSVADSISAQRKDDLAEDALKIITAYKAMRPDDIMRIIDSIEDNDEYVYLWNLLAKETKVRAFIKETLAAREKATA